MKYKKHVIFVKEYKKKHVIIRITKFLLSIRIIMMDFLELAKIANRLAFYYFSVRFQKFIHHSEKVQSPGSQYLVLQPVT